MAEDKGNCAPKIENKTENGDVSYNPPKGATNITADNHNNFNTNQPGVIADKADASTGVRAGKGGAVTKQAIRKAVKKLRLIDDVLFQKLAEDKLVVQEMLRIILEDPSLEVIAVTPQNSIQNLFGRSVRLDALCDLSGVGKCNIEVQKADNDDHLKRVRYHASCITANITDIERI